MGLLLNRKKPARPVGNSRIVEVREYPQSGTFRGYRRYRLTTYQEPGVEEGIQSLRSGDPKKPFNTRSAVVRLVLKEVSGVYASPFNVLEVYVNQHKVGVLYDGNSQYATLFSEPFDKVYVLIEETVGRGKFFDGIEVYLFAHYPGGGPVKVDYSVQ